MIGKLHQMIDECNNFFDNAPASYIAKFNAKKIIDEAKMEAPKIEDYKEKDVYQYAADWEVWFAKWFASKNSKPTKSQLSKDNLADCGSVNKEETK